jgi:hypothetical protein
METETIQITEQFSEIGTKSLDERKRIVLDAGLESVHAGVSRFKIYEGRNGDVLLRPVVEIPAREAWLFTNKKALASVRRGLEQSAQGKTKALDLRRLAAAK